MRLSDFFLISLQSLKRRRLRSWLTVIGIFIGIVAIVTLISLGQGLEAVIVGQFSLAGVDVIVVQAKGTSFGAPGTGVIKPLTQKNLDAIQRISEVEYAVGRIVKTGLVEFNDRIEVRFIGSLSESAKENELLNLEAEKGRLLKGSDRGKVTVGHELMNKDLFGKPVQIGSTLIIKEEKFEVVGILKKKGSFITDTTILMSEEDIKRIFEEENFNAVAVKVKQGIDIGEAKTSIDKVMRKERDVKIGEEDFSVETNENAVKNLKSTLFAVQLFVYIIAAISIIVGGIGIMNTMYTSVLERTKDIGIMKAIGAKNSTIFTLFFIESGLIGTVGGVAGIIIGVGVAKGLAFIGRTVLDTNLISAHIQPWLLIGALVFSFVVGTISGLLPARKASKMPPVEALRE
ncbi:MAG: ABC transporter permease [Nanoarchaeota archaeon]|nr:ABC transporter permease [Nanoarchaeota archaeon]MBU1269638.1 ABC transporter permease [Nanoarchaeota archaeon]MBU1604753.1 ABC transporter permease [Nanoarchaeota archaeon]MBU2443376.1 ABC transporter permease [Nanoarchaeota archaeon]